MRPIALLPLILAGCGSKDTTPAAPPVGWYAEEGWTMSCYFPPDFSSFNETERRMKRAEVLDEMLDQWRGTREDGVAFDEEVIDGVETVLLGRPEKIEAIVQQNLSQCKQVAGGGTLSAWSSWAKSLPATLTAGECATPFDFTMFDYLDIGTGWQRTMGICQGDLVRISGTVSDRYRISDKGDWITVEGDTSQVTTGADWPCNFEGCYAGMLILRFVSDAGIETIMPVGAELIFEAPQHGEISYRINDTTFYDNKWYQQGSLIDHASIEISPVVRVSE